MNFFKAYSERLHGILSNADWAPVELLAEDLLVCWKERRRVFICGNGGSSSNADHIANDLLYGVAKDNNYGVRVNSLSSNHSIVTCLANDKGYETIFSKQLEVQAQDGDLLIVLSGSGNSSNIIEVLKSAKAMGVTSYGILGFSGGKAKEMVDHPIHFEIDDMQISEDLQIIVSHMVTQWLYARHEEI